VREHEGWCASRYRYENTPPMACDCGAEKEIAQELAPFNPLAMLKKRKKTGWLGKLPAQFCVKCEGARTKRVAIVPADPQQPERVFAACMDAECAHLRELQTPA
jgi:hypothetical protein